MGFRAGFYGCLTHWGDALFELCDAALCAGAPVASVPALSLGARVPPLTWLALQGPGAWPPRRGAFQGALGRAPADGWPEIFAVDASTWDRCDAECSPERGFYYSASKHSAGQPIVAGWSYQWIAQLGFSADSWTAPLDARRIRPEEDATTATVEQVQELVGRPGGRPRRSRCSSSTPAMTPSPSPPAWPRPEPRCCVRIRGDRVFYRDPPPGRTDAHRGRPRRHGRRLKLSDARTMGRPDAELEHHRCPLRHRAGAGLAWCAPKDHRTRSLGG